MVGQSPTCPDCTEGATHFSAGYVWWWRKVFVKPNTLYLGSERSRCMNMEPRTTNKPSLALRNSSWLWIRDSTHKPVSVQVQQHGVGLPCDGAFTLILSPRCSSPEGSVSQSIICLMRKVPASSILMLSYKRGRGRKWLLCAVLFRVCTLAAAGSCPQCWI